MTNYKQFTDNITTNRELKMHNSIDSAVTTLEYKSQGKYRYGLSWINPGRPGITCSLAHFTRPKRWQRSLPRLSMCVNWPKHIKRFVGSMKDCSRYFPYCAKGRVYGALACIRCDSDTDRFAYRKGLLVIRATGGIASILNDGNFKPRAFPEKSSGLPKVHPRAVPDCCPDGSDVFRDVVLQTSVHC